MPHAINIRIRIVRSNNIFIDEVVICRMSTEKKMVFMLLTLAFNIGEKKKKWKKSKKKQ